MAGPLPPSHGGDPCAEGATRFHRIARTRAACLRSLAASHADRLFQPQQEESPHEPV